MNTLMVIAVDGSDLVALTPISRVEIARQRVMGETTSDHISAGWLLVRKAFQNLEAQGYPRAESR